MTRTALDELSDLLACQTLETYVASLKRLRDSDFPKVLLEECQLVEMRIEDHEQPES